ncbi:hypothetical protein [Phormidium sp. FACHB-1136]|uniref:hypothetical protein n=1 Tax=Phormidium sp. FACHB-1136 TaxID=2692848 RepID=UPI0016899412|nr:hypothetical protein [Phormidium sp. FACHB-1136]MBD2426017.1 hypothetical protein [Phormidium sp. FACHB-1136]
MQDSQYHLNEAYVYVPTRPKNINATMPDLRYVDLALEGAKENSIEELVRKLEGIKQDYAA